MKISIITVCFNSGKTIRDTFDSLLSQTYSEIEFIVKDGGSKDDTLEIIKQYESIFAGRMKWTSERDNGIYDAMNQGIKMATGDVIGILNSDDVLWDHNVLDKIMSTFSTENCDVLYGDLVFVDEDDLSKICRTWKTGSYSLGSFKRGWHPPHPTFYVKKEIYDNYGLFDTTLDVSADFEIMLRFIEKNRLKVSYIDNYLVRMRMGGNSTGSFKKILIGNRNVLKAFKKNQIPVSFLYPLYRIIPKIFNVILNRLRFLVLKK